MSRTPDEIVEEWRQKREEGWTTKRIARHWGAGESTVRAHLGKTGKRRYSEDDVEQWRQRIMSGWTIKEVAAQANVSTSTVDRLVGPMGLRRRNYDPLLVDDAVAAYDEHGTIRGAAAALGVTENVMRMRLYEAGRAAYPGGTKPAESHAPNPPRGIRRGEPGDPYTA